MIIRSATLADVQAVLDMSADFYASTPFKEWGPMDREQVESLVLGMIKDHILLVAEVDGKVIGMAGLLLIPFMFNPEVKHASEVVWYIDPSYESKGVGIALLKSMEEEARDRGAEIISMMALSTSPPVASKAYKAMGYTETETMYSKKLNTEENK